MWNQATKLKQNAENQLKQLQFAEKRSATGLQKMIENGEVVMFDFSYCGLRDLKKEFGNKIYEKVGMFLKIINSKRYEKDEPKVTNKKIISSAFVNLENDTDVEIKITSGNHSRLVLKINIFIIAYPKLQQIWSKSYRRRRKNWF